GIDAHAALVIDLRFIMVEDVEIDILQVFQHIRTGCIAMCADEDGMRHVRPERGVLHGHIAAAAGKTATCTVYGGAIVGVPVEYAIDQYIVAGHHVHAVAPAKVADALYIP